MFIHYRTQAFFLKKADSGESDRIFTIYTRDFGKLEILGKAIRKISSKLRSGAEIFYLSEIEFIQGKVQKTLTDVILINKFKNLRKDLKRLQITYRISEVLDSLIKGQEPDEKIWRLLNKTFQELNNNTLKPVVYNLIYYYFLWNLLSVLGYQPELYNCSGCQKKLTPENIYFSPKEKGLFCSQCGGLMGSAKEIGPEAVKIMRITIKRDWSTLKRLKIEDKDLNQFKLISDYYLTEVLSQIE